MFTLCIKCKGKGWCGKPCEILARFKDKAPKPKLHFSGSSPPEIFVGRVGYPRVFSGILAPTEKGETSQLASPEQWVENNLNIEQILELRGQLIYGRSIIHIKSNQGRIKQVTQELAMSSKPVSTEIFLSKKPNLNFHPSKVFSIMTNPAPLKKAILEENPKIEKKVDYLVSDYDVKSTIAIKELYQSKILTSHLQKLLAAGLLGIKTTRRMVPTRWAITAVDDTLGKQLLEKIRIYPEINQFQLFHYDYNGNHFEILFLPGNWTFEVIGEQFTLGKNKYKGNKSELGIGVDEDVFMQDYEGFFPRKKYAEQVAGGYYADRLGVCEYLEKIKKQATCLVFHEERPEYYAPLGVGIIRESVRKAMQTKPETPQTINEALIQMGMRLKAPIHKYKKMSWVLEHYGKQKKITEFFNH